MKRRLDKICSLCEGNICADIGCDHGYLCEMLIDKHIKEIYACEVTEKNLDKAKNNIVNYVLNHCQNINIKGNTISYQGGNVTFVLSNGLQILPDCAIIAGMGGDLILNILFDDLNKLPKVIVLQPNTKVDKVRMEIIKYYKIVEDIIVYDCDHYYNVIKAELGKDKLSELEIAFGRTNLKLLHQDFRNYIKYLKDYAKNIKTEKFEKLLSQIEKVEEMYE